MRHRRRCIGDPHADAHGHPHVDLDAHGDHYSDPHLDTDAGADRDAVTHA
jgi:hypothetical protein